MTSPTGYVVQYVLQILYTDSNNAAEYEALLHGLRMVVSMGIQRLEVRGDSNLAISQINGDFDAKDPKMADYRNAVLKMAAHFEGLEFHNPRMKGGNSWLKFMPVLVVTTPRLGPL